MEKTEAKKLSKKEKKNLKNLQKAERKNKLQEAKLKPPKEQELDKTGKPDYIKIGPFRLVKEYKYNYQCHVKERWRGRTIEEVLKKEFMAYTPSYYDEAIKNGNILVNSKPVASDYVLKSTDFIEHNAIRKEPPVFNKKIEVIYEDKELLIVDKPPSMPVHICGSYFYNSLQAILKFEYKLEDLFILHRLDKLTSGILLLAKMPELVTYFHDENKEETIGKTYVARVEGKFPEEETVVDKFVYCESHKENKYATCEAAEADEKKAKSAKTIFKRVWHEEKFNTSLIECRLMTGRTHQIRIHLKHLGFSIINDIHYGGKFVGNLITVFGELPTLPKKHNNPAHEKGEEEVDQTEAKEINHSPSKKLKMENDNFKIVDLISNEEKVVSIDESVKQIYSGIFSKNDWDFENHPMEIWLHSLIYNFKGKDHKSREPYWMDPSIDLNALNKFSTASV